MLSSYFRLETGFEPGTFGVAFNASVLRPNANWDKIVVLVFTIIYIFLQTFYETQNLVFLQNINFTVFFFILIFQNLAFVFVQIWKITRFYVTQELFEEFRFFLLVSTHEIKNFGSLFYTVRVHNILSTWGWCTK